MKQPNVRSSKTSPINYLSIRSNLGAANRVTSPLSASQRSAAQRHSTQAILSNAYDNSNWLPRPLICLLLVCCSCFVAVPAQAQQSDFAADSIRYTVDLADSKNHYLNITAKFPTSGDETEVMMAVWTPGSYLIREYARLVDTVAAADSKGKPLAIEKTRKNRWTVQTKGLKRFQITYRVYCNELTVRTNFAGQQYAMINGAPTFMTLPDGLDKDHLVRLVMPPNWKRSATSLRAVTDTPHTFLAKGFDELVDSPIVAGNINVYPFTVSGIEHQLVNVGESGYWDGTQAATDLKRVVQAHHDMWGSIPYDRYLFINMICEAGGGLEHDNSTLIMTSRWSFREPGRYKSWLSLASHEFFHTWNVRRLRPSSLVKYDYENEVYTDGLWIAEGVTSYYQDLALVRAGVLSRDEYLGKISRNVESLQRTNGRLKQSLKESSYDAWIKYYRPDENSSNTTISYYTKGAVVAFLLDAKIRKLTEGKKSLDDVMRTMFAKYSTSGFTSVQFRETASRIAGQDLSDWFASAVDSTDELNYLDLELLGIAVPNKKLQQARVDKQDAEVVVEASEDDGNEEPKTQAKGRPWLGMSTSSSDGRLEVTGVTPDSPASDAGVSIDDEVIGVNGFRVSGSVDGRLGQYEIGEELDLLLARRGELLTLKVKIGSRESLRWGLRFDRQPSKEQKNQQDAWLSPPSKASL